MQSAKVVIFDFDDTMYVGDVWQNWDKFFSELVAEFFKNQPEKLESLRQKYPPYNFENMVGAAKMLSAENLDVEEFFRLAHKKTYKHTAKTKELKIVSPKFLKFLRKNCTTYIVSVSCQKYLRHYMKKYHIHIARKNVLSVEICKCKFKKECYEAILEKEKCLPEEILVIGNSLTDDIVPAQELGFQTLLFGGDHKQIYDYFGWEEKK